MSGFTSASRLKAIPSAVLLFVVLPLGTASAHHRRATMYDDTNSAIVYSQGQNGDGVNGWGSGSDGNDFGGGEHYSNAYSGSFVVHFSGTDFQWIGKKGPNFGIASLFLDGQSVGTVDAYSPSQLYQQVLYSVTGLDDRAHSFQMMIGTYPSPARNPASSDCFQVMDGFATSGTPLNLSMVSPADGSVTKVGTWSFGPNVLSGQYCWSNDRGTPASLTFPFSGTGFEVYGHPEGEDGMTDVYVDGSYVTTFDLYNPLHDSVLDDATNDTLVYVLTGLAGGNHSLKLVVSQNHNASALDYYTQIDGVIFLPTTASSNPPPPPPSSGGGALSGSSAGGPASAVDLTAIGTSDWAYWEGMGNFIHKASGGGQISDITLVGSGGNYGTWQDASRTVTWSDGTPTASGTDGAYVWSNAALGTGFSFTVPADTTPRTLLVFYGASNATATLSAHLSDGSASDYSNSNMGPGAWMETLTYQAASDGQLLTVTLLKTGNNSGSTDGSADLVAAMLQDGSSGGSSTAGGDSTGGSSSGGASSTSGSGNSGHGKGEANCGATGAETLIILGCVALFRRRSRAYDPR